MVGSNLTSKQSSAQLYCDSTNLYTYNPLIYTAVSWETKCRKCVLAGARCIAFIHVLVAVAHEISSAISRQNIHQSSMDRNFDRYQSQSMCNTSFSQKSKEVTPLHSVTPVPCLPCPNRGHYSFPARSCYSLSLYVLLLSLPLKEKLFVNNIHKFILHQR
jgi:hypothetical protein